MKVFLSFLLQFLFFVNLHAEAPNLLTYQGRLKEGGQAVSGNRMIDIQLCDDETVGNCHSSGEQSVTVSNGLFRSTFTVPVTALIGTGNWYLKIAVGGVPLTPRERLTSTTYSLFAATAAYASNIAAAAGSDGVHITSNVFIVGFSSASKFYGDGSELTNLPVSGGAVSKLGDTMTGTLTINAASALTTANQPELVISTNIYVVGYSSAAMYYGNGSLLTGISATTVADGSVTDTKIVTVSSSKLTGPVPPTLIDLSTVTTALALKADSASVLANNATVSPALIDLSTVTAALAGKLANNETVSPLFIGLSTVTTALGTKLDKAGDNMTGQLTNTSSITVSGNGGQYGLMVSSGVSLAGLIYTNNGKVGIGTTTPTNQLEVVNDGSTLSPLTVKGTSAQSTNINVQFDAGNSGIHMGYTSGTGQYFSNTGTGDMFLKAFSTTNTKKLFLGATFNTAAGLVLVPGAKVGVGGQTAPAYVLDVSGDGHFTSSLTVDGGYYGSGANLTGLTASQIPYISTISYLSSTQTFTGDNTFKDVSARTLTATSANITGDFAGYGIAVTSNVSLAGALYTKNGNVGIGVTAPTAKLQVGGTPGLDGIQFPDGTLMTSAGAGSASNLSNLVDAVINADSDANATGALHLQVGGTDKLTILNGGNVGIGIATPQAGLNVVSQVQTAGLFEGAGQTELTLQSNGGGTTEFPTYLTFNAYSVPNGGVRAMGYLGFDNSGNMIFSNTNNGFTGGTRMLIAAAGNIGISTGAPQARLDVLAGGSGQADMAQIWRKSNGDIVSSMSATGVMAAARFVGDGSGLTGLPGGDSLGSHIATMTLTMNTFNIVNAGSITANAAITTYSSMTVTGNGGRYGLQVSSGVSLAGLIDTNNGKVGIGSATPGARLDVYGPNTVSFLETHNSSNSDRKIVRISQFSNHGLLSVYNSNETIAIELNADSVVPSYLNAGSVGIGTTLPDQKLTVNGNISQTGVLISSGAGNNYFAGDITAARYQIDGSTVMAILQGSGSLGVGVNAGRISTGDYNVFIGSAAGYSTTGAGATSNNFVGYMAGYNNSSGNQNNFIGREAGKTNTTGGNNTFVGTSAGYGNNTGMENSYLGDNAGYSNADGRQNVALGASAGAAGGSSFSSSTLVGFEAGSGITTGIGNTLLGYKAGDNVVSGNSNIIIGNNQDATASTISDELNIGGVLRGNLSAGTIGIGFSNTIPLAALDVKSTGTASDNIYAQIWRDSNGTPVASMTVTGRLSGDGSGLTGIISSPDNLGSHVATLALDMAQFPVVNVSSMAMVGDGLRIATSVSPGASGIFISTGGAIQTTGVGYGTVAGNARGIGAVDLQTMRNIATNVASGNYSVIGGGYWNTAGSNYATVSGGYNNAATGYISFIGGGQMHTASGTEAAIAGGYGNQALGTRGFIGGGSGNSISADQTEGVIAGGYQNTLTGAGQARTIGGGLSNAVSGNVATIAGGWSNEATGEFSIIGGGRGNDATGSESAVLGGHFNAAAGNYSAVGGGYYNSIVSGANAAFIGGGESNVSTGAYSTVGGGRLNTSSGAYNAVLGGLNNISSGTYSNIGGGKDNSTYADYAVVGGGLYNKAGITGGGESASTVGGGKYNWASGVYTTISGGYNNRAIVNQGTIGGGQSNLIDSGGSTVIGGGESNYINGNYSTIAGGGSNSVGVPGFGASYSTIGGGTSNKVLKGYGTVAGGWYNIASAANANGYPTIGGGSYNTTTGDYSTIGGGSYNSAGGTYATVPGGNLNTAKGDYSFAAGRTSSSTASGAFTWADSEGAPVVNSVPDRTWFKNRGGFLVSGSTNAADPGLFVAGNGNVGIGITTPIVPLQLNSGGSADKDTLLIGNNSTKGVGIRDTGSSIDIESFGVPLFFQANTAQPVYFYASPVGIGISNSPSAKLEVKQTNLAGYAYTLKVGTGTTSSHLVVSTTGNVGIGTANPGSLLEVRNGALKVIGPNSSFTNTLTIDGANSVQAISGFYASEANPRLAIGMDLINGYGFGQAGIAFSAVGSASGLVNAIGTDINSNLGFFTGGTANTDEKMTIMAGGNVGIGVVSPGQALEVNGGIRINTATVQPVCSVTTRGTFWIVQGGAGVKDNVQVCAKDAGEAYAWRVVY